MEHGQQAKMERKKKRKKGWGREQCAGYTDAKRGGERESIVGLLRSTATVYVIYIYMYVLRRCIYLYIFIYIDVKSYSAAVEK